MNQSRINPNTTLVTRTLWRLETQIGKTPSLSELAAAEQVSPFHLSRAFSLIVGKSVIAYARARRLSEAARRLHEGSESVLNVALDAGYESPEGFSRAFRDFFGVSPSLAREALPNSLQEPIIMRSHTEKLLSAKIADAESRTIIGRAARFTPEERPKVPAFWDKTIEELGHRMIGRETFGVSYNFDDDTFEYLVGFEDDGDGEGLDRIKISSGRYAVFEHVGHISEIPDTWESIFDQWLPHSKEILGEGPEFECYKAEFHPEKPGNVSIWIPLGD